MEKALTHRREREAAGYLKQVVDYIIVRFAPRPFTSDEYAEIHELCELAIHEAVEAAADKGRGQIQ